MTEGFSLYGCQKTSPQPCAQYTQLFQGLRHPLKGEIKHVEPIRAAIQTLIKSGTHTKLNTRQESYSTNTNVVDYVIVTNPDRQLFLISPFSKQVNWCF